MQKNIIMAGDIGGTKTSLGIYSQEAGTIKSLHEKTYASDHHSSLNAILDLFLADIDYKIATACFGVAGPVINGRVSITKLPWTMAENEISTRYDFSSVRLINDLVATAHGLPLLNATDLYTINEGKPVAGGAKAIIAPGTGLGETFMTWNGSGYDAHGSEGGHTDFAPTGKEEIELLQFLQMRHEHVSYDWLCSGRGLPNIYDFLKSSGRAPEPAWLNKELATADDPSPTIVEAALNDERSCELARLTLKTFVSILGAEAGNLALKVLATGGIYLGGGIPPRIIAFLQDETFMKSFRRKGRLSGLLNDVPVRVILAPETALLGAASYGFAMVGADG